ncbi:MAG: hypothetical protein CSA65_08040 [Proteobacteria bacterium]|nr:MAG: hypothetical protein CSB49_00505 [Pseudomonadota bacterium]PIE17691.1 MAG: hypothetical protein CSA65_08040 [Pseudomonadota bacterium]
MLRPILMSLVAFPLLLTGAQATATPSDGGLVIADGSTPLDLSLTPQDLDYPDTECGCTPAPNLLHPDFGLNEGGVDALVEDATAREAGPRDAHAAEMSDTKLYADLPWGCQLGDAELPRVPWVQALLFGLWLRRRGRARAAS